MNEGLGFVEPRTYGPHRPVQVRKRRPRGIQTPEPPAQGGRISYAIGVFDHGRRGLPAAALDKVAPHRLAAGNEAVLCVRWRELREEGEGLVARSANAPPNLNPIVLLIVSLLAPGPCPTMESRSQIGHRRTIIWLETMAQSPSSLRGSSGSETRRIVANEGSARTVTCPDRRPKPGSSSLRNPTDRE